MIEYDRLINASPALFIAADRQGNAIDLRGPWLETLGYEPEFLRGKPMMMLVHPDDRASAWAALEEAHRTGQPTAQYEVRNLHRDGSVRWISWTSPAPEDGVAFALGIDITSRKAAEQQLEEARGALRSVLETMPCYVLKTDCDGVIEYINRTYPGVTREQIVGTHLLNWLPPAHREPMQAALARIVAGAESAEFVGQGSGAHGVAWYRSRLGPIMQGGKVAGVTVVGEDITEARMAEERHVQASRLEAVGRVAGAIAHDFNNLLMVMSSEVTMMEFELPPDADPLQEHIEGLHRTIASAADMTRGLLDAVRANKHRESGRLELVTAVRALEQVLTLALGSGVTLSFDSEVERIHVELAQFELQQILVNLAVNAREALDKSGHVQVSVRARSMSDATSWLAAGRYAELVVRDNGPGIPEDFLPRALEPFATTKAGGTGLGLATCHTIARARGGEVELRCPPQGGTEVTVRLPALDAIEDPTAAAAGAQPKLRHVLTILLVEDNEALRVNMARYLTRVGHTVLEACDGADALAVFDRHPAAVDVVVTELRMPDMDGIALAKQLRAKMPSVPIRVVSGACDADQRAELEEMSVPVMNKPVRPQALLDAIVADAGARSAALPR